MQVVSSQSDEDIRRTRARADSEWAMVELTANLLRIIRGAGKPYELGRHLSEVMRTMQQHYDVVGFWPYDEMAEAVRLPDVWDRAAERPGNAAELYAIHSIVRGSLQMIASDLLGQRTQRVSGEHELYGGANDLEAFRQEQRKRWLAERKATTPGQRSAAARALVRARLKKSKKPPPTK